MLEDPQGEPVRVYRREAFGLTVLIIVGIVGFLLTRAIAAANRQMHLNDAAHWHQLALAQLAAQRPAQAVTALRRAVAIDRDNTRYRLQLASALAASGQDDSARQVLVALRQFTPEDPDINLQLARLEGRRQDLTATIQYYQNALYGPWPPSRIDERRAVRRELIDYLLAHSQRSRALSELLILSANTPDDAQSQHQIGELLLKAGDPRRALDHLTRALRLAPQNPAILASAGEAAFTAGDYAQARKYFRSVPTLSGPLADMREIADIVMTTDPLAPRLKLDERYRRLRIGLERASQRVASCSGVEAQRDELAAFTGATTRRAVGQDPDLIDQGLDLIDQVERAAAAHCGAGTPADRAWQTISARHAGSEGGSDQ